ncbi:DUF4397 domain-containing protein [Rheinheimera maricola]|uniref:DUF4397 domain-containing protein n=1 Tax=Rheinheimera maricola TaxID=2793282 RepID=A0ABS7X4L1_9GAMM|nr:DUF4397 domain-containing protein [Rheinheimera maricola]MBZ9610478.1 DUF4397 domain-containing protein [Rheinheimera maricola]
MKPVYLAPLLALSSILILAGCGGSSSNSSATAETYLQFYNGAANSGNTSLKAGDIAIGTAVYGDVSALVAIKPDSYSLELTDVVTAEDLLTEDMALAEGKKTLFILTQQEDQLDYLSLSFTRDDGLENQFKLHLANLSAENPQLDVYMSAENKGFADAELLDALAFQEISSISAAKDIGKFNLYLTAAGTTTPLFVANSVNFAYANHYVLIVRDKHGPIAEQLSVDVVLNSSTVTAYDHADAQAQFRLYNSLAQPVNVEIDNQQLTTLAPSGFSNYLPLNKGDYSLSLRTADDQLLLNSALLSLVAGDSKAVLVYANEQQQVEALSIAEADAPQLKAHDISVANLAADFDKLHFYFVRQNETISNARYSVKNLAFKKQQSLNLPKDYYAISLVHVAENGSTTLLDKTASMMLEPGKHYMLLAEQDDAAPSGYKLKLVH